MHTSKLSLVHIHTHILTHNPLSEPSSHSFSLPIQPYLQIHTHTYTYRAVDWLCSSYVSYSLALTHERVQQQQQQRWKAKGQEDDPLSARFLHPRSVSVSRRRATHLRARSRHDNCVHRLTAERSSSSSSSPDVHRAHYKRGDSPPRSSVHIRERFVYVLIVGLNHFLARREEQRSRVAQESKERERRSKRSPLCSLQSAVSVYKRYCF